jgi:hypothetical protein
MAIVRDEQGNLRVSAGGVSLPWAFGDQRAQALGLNVPPMPGLTSPGRGAIAFGDSSSPGMGGGGNVPDVPVEVPGAGGSSGIGGPGSAAGGAPGNQDQGGNVGAPASPEMTHAEPSAPKAKSEAKAAGLKNGAQEADLPDSPEPMSGGRVSATGGGARLIPGKMQLAGYSRQVGAPKEDLAAVNAANQSAAEAGGQELAAGAMGETIRNANMMQALGQQIEHKQALVGQAEDKINAARQDYDQAQAEINNERGKVDSLDKDPHRYFAGNGSVAKIIGLIAAAVGGGIQSGLNKSGRNPYLEGIQRIVAEDNAEWQRRKDVGRSAVNLRQKQLDARMQHFDPDMQARELEADKLALAAAMDQKFALGTRNAEIIAASNARAEQLKAEAAKIRAENDVKLGDQITERHVQTPDRVVGGTAALKPEARERLVTFDNGNARGFVVAGPAREKVQTGITNFENLTAGAAELAALAEQAHLGNLEAKRKYNSLRGTLMAESNVAVGQGAISKDDASRVEQSLPDVAEMTTTRENAVTRLKQFGRWAKSRRDSVIRDNVYQDPDANSPALRGQSPGRRLE